MDDGACRNVVALLKCKVRGVGARGSSGILGGLQWELGRIGVLQQTEGWIKQCNHASKGSNTSAEALQPIFVRGRASRHGMLQDAPQSCCKAALLDGHLPLVWTICRLEARKAS